LIPFHAPDTYNGNDLDYDANGNLVEDEDFIYSCKDANQFYEVDNGTATSYFFRDDERIAKETAGDMEWYLSDHLGSTTLLINESGLEVERTEYYPYGQVQSGGLEKYGFTGQESDADTELMYYGARYYSPEYRIFVQPDTMIPDLYNPQALNRYAYCLNNPVRYSDPSGHEPVSATLVALVILKVTTAAIDYGWTAHDIKNDMDVINDPNSAAVDRQVAAADMTLALVFEAAEPDELLLINLPLDDLARKGVMKEGEELIVKYAPDSLRVATKNNYRKLYLETHPGLPEGWQVHHSLPQKYENIMTDAGINIHETQYLRGIDAYTHKQITKEWQKWDKSLGRDPTSEEIIDFSRQIDEKYKSNWFKDD
jgi:RHS repeat-associated protein